MSDMLHNMCIIVHASYIILKLTTSGLGRSTWANELKCTNVKHHVATSTCLARPNSTSGTKASANRQNPLDHIVRLYIDTLKETIPCQAFRPALTTDNNMKINANPSRKNLRTRWTRCVRATFLRHPASEWTEGFSQGMSRKAVTTPGPLFSSDAAPAAQITLVQLARRLRSTSFNFIPYIL